MLRATLKKTGTRYRDWLFDALVVDMNLVCIGDLDDSCGRVFFIISHMMRKAFFFSIRAARSL